MCHIQSLALDLFVPSTGKYKEINRFNFDPPPYRQTSFYYLQQQLPLTSDSGSQERQSISFRGWYGFKRVEQASNFWLLGSIWGWRLISRKSVTIATDDFSPTSWLRNCLQPKEHSCMNFVACGLYSYMRCWRSYNGTSRGISSQQLSEPIMGTVFWFFCLLNRNSWFWLEKINAGVNNHNKMPKAFYFMQRYIRLKLVFFGCL